MGRLAIFLATPETRRKGIRPLQCDLCVIGAGAAGITIACEFIGTRRNVILRKAATSQMDAEVQSLNAGENVGLTYTALETGVGAISAGHELLGWMVPPL